MYELVLLFLFGVIVFFVYLFGCKMISINTINSIPVLFPYTPHVKQKNLLLDMFGLIRLILMGLRDTESGYFARLNARISSTPQLMKSRAHKSLLTFKISECLIILALILPIKFFIIFLIVLIGISVVNERKISAQTMGIFLGYLLLKSCIEVTLYISESTKELAFESFPGYLYYEFSKEHAWMFLINGAIASIVILNVSLLFPLILILSAVVKINLLQFLYTILGIFAGLVIRHYIYAEKTRGFYSTIIKENTLFYILTMFCTLFITLLFYLYFPNALNLVMDLSNLTEGVFLILLITLLSIVAMLFLRIKGMNQGLINMIFLKDRKNKVRYKYSKALFKETFLGMKILMNELRTYSIEQVHSCRNRLEYLKNKHLNIDAVELPQDNFKNYTKELGDYLKILLQSEEMQHYEDTLILCTKFLEDGKALEENCIKKFNIFKKIYEEIDIQKFNAYFSQITKCADTIFGAYITALESLDKNDIQTLLTLIDDESITIQDLNKILDDYFSADETITENQKTLLLDLISLCQENRWLINQQGLILNKWYDITLDTPYILGRI